MYQFQYFRPTSLDEARKLFENNGDAKFLAGGQTLIPALKLRLAQPTALIDLGAIAGLSGIKAAAGTVTVGARATHFEVANSADIKKAIPALAYLAEHVGDPAVRHLGTIGGSVANNDPAADYPAAVLGLGARAKTPSHQAKTPPTQMEGQRGRVGSRTWLKARFRRRLQECRSGRTGTSTPEWSRCFREPFPGDCCCP